MNTSMSSSIKLDKDDHVTSIYITKYRGMIASRPVIMFSVYLCARVQFKPKESHFSAIK